VPEPAKKNNSRTSSVILSREQDKSVTGSSISKKSIFTVGSRLSNGAILKEVSKEQWTFTGEVDSKKRKFYKCNECGRARTRDDNRKTHKCV
jgi:DNA-binding PadR family transcriptional regulator